VTQGLLAEIHENGRKVEDCLIIGRGVPRIHHADRVPVFLVTEHARGSIQRLKNARDRVPLLAYPVAWPGPGRHSRSRYIFAHHAELTFEAPVPLFDQEVTSE
jgi:hypothetical protein